MTPEEFENYIASQETEAAATNPEPLQRASGRKFSFGWLIYTIPFFTVIALFCSWQFATNMKASKRTAVWDTILGSTAKATGRKYNSNANSLTEKLTLRNKKSVSN
jgi:hypothetical protein